MTQLPLALPSGHTRRPRLGRGIVEAQACDRLTAAHVLWLGAGRPECPEIADCPPGACWWCARPVGPRGRPLSTLPDTFPSHHLAAVPDSRWLCVACGWTLSDAVRLPPAYAAGRIARMADEGRRCIVAVGDAAPERRLLLRLADGQVGLWSPGPNATAEEAWVAAREALREAPRDVGPCRYLGAVSLDALGDGPAKWRSFHHLATVEPGSWWVATDSDRAAIRAWLIDPPAQPWAAVIGDGKAHAAIYGRPSPARGRGIQCVTFRPSRASADEGIDYDPQALARQIAAWEALILAGAGDDEIETGRYADRGLGLLRARREHDPILAPLRGGPRIGLVRYLRRGRKELT